MQQKLTYLFISERLRVIGLGLGQKIHDQFDHQVFLLRPTFGNQERQGNQAVVIGNYELKMQNFTKCRI